MITELFNHCLFYCSDKFPELGDFHEDDDYDGEELSDDERKQQLDDFHAERTLDVSAMNAALNQVRTKPVESGSWKKRKKKDPDQLAK